MMLIRILSLITLAAILIGSMQPVFAEVDTTPDEPGKVEISSINQANGTMTITGYETLTENGRGIIAIYNDDMLETIYLSDNLADSENGTLEFVSLPDFDGKRVKGFLWEDDDELTIKPLADVFDYTQTSEPTLTPTTEPTATPDVLDDQDVPDAPRNIEIPAAATTYSSISIIWDKPEDYYRI